jgi:hypothetical protein
MNKLCAAASKRGERETKDTLLKAIMERQDPKVNEKCQPNAKRRKPKKA